MKIKYRTLPDGAFVCGDHDTKVTAYAYPTSPHAVQGKRRGEHTAVDMLRAEIAFRPACHVNVDLQGYDAQNWARIGESV